MEGRTRSTIDRRLRDCCSFGRCSSSSVARIAPHRECPSTTTSRVPNRSAANSTLPTCDGATMLPATRMTKRSPRPWSKTISAGTRESEHPRMMAKGSWPAINSLRRVWLLSASVLTTSEAKRRFPSRNRWSACKAGIMRAVGDLGSDNLLEAAVGHALAADELAGFAAHGGQARVGHDFLVRRVAVLARLEHRVGEDDDLAPLGL